MYSMVLMAALTTGTDMPDWGRRGGCCGCYGGYGGWGGGYARGGWGGYGGGGWGGYGGGGWGGYGGMGGYGGLGGWGGLGYVYAPVSPIYTAPMLAANTLPAVPLTRSMYYNPDISANNRASIIVRLPETATLTVNGQPTSSTSSSRRFYSPLLEPGKSYHYTFVAQMERNGKTVRTDRSVDLSAGDRREITLTLPDLDRVPERQQQAAPAENKDIRERQLQVNRR